MYPTRIGRPRSSRSLGRDTHLGVHSHSCRWLSKRRYHTTSVCERRRSCEDRPTGPQGRHTWSAFQHPSEVSWTRSGPGNLIRPANESQQHGGRTEQSSQLAQRHASRRPNTTKEAGRQLVSVLLDPARPGAKLRWSRSRRLAKVRETSLSPNLHLSVLCARCYWTKSEGSGVALIKCFRGRPLAPGARECKHERQEEEYEAHWGRVEHICEDAGASNKPESPEGPVTVPLLPSQRCSVA